MNNLYTISEGKKCICKSFSLEKAFAFLQDYIETELAEGEESEIHIWREQ